MKSIDSLLRRNVRTAKKLFPDVTALQIARLREVTRRFGLSLLNGDLILIEGRWYVTHSGLLGLAERKRCRGIVSELVTSAFNPQQNRWVFKAVVTTLGAGAFAGYGDADPSNVSPLMHGSEMRIAETRAVNRALRKAYGIGICSVEELGSVATDARSTLATKKAPQQANGNGYGGRKLRDRLCQLIRQHQLDPALVKAYATDFCGTKILREATREQVEAFVQHLADCAEKDRNALLCQLNSYLKSSEAGAA